MGSIPIVPSGRVGRTGVRPYEDKFSKRDAPSEVYRKIPNMFDSFPDKS